MFQINELINKSKAKQKEISHQPKIKKLLHLITAVIGLQSVGEAQWESAISKSERKQEHDFHSCFLQMCNEMFYICRVT